MENTQNTAVHPSRTGNQCNACGWVAGRSIYQNEATCNHHSLPVDIVSGLPEVLCSTARGIPSSEQLYKNVTIGTVPMGFNACGKEGKLFQARRPLVVKQATA
jgi:hypothetical protein